MTQLRHIAGLGLVLLGISFNCFASSAVYQCPHGIFKVDCSKSVFQLPDISGHGVVWKTSGSVDSKLCENGNFTFEKTPPWQKVGATFPQKGKKEPTIIECTTNQKVNGSQATLSVSATLPSGTNCGVENFSHGRFLCAS